MIKNKNNNKTKNNNIQQRKKQLSRESNLDHLQGRSAPRPLAWATLPKPITLTDEGGKVIILKVLFP